MAIEVNTEVQLESTPGPGPDNLVLLGAKFWGKPNFSGETDRFGEDDRKFTVLLPLDAAEKLQELGWNVKVTEPKEEDQEPLAHMKVAVDFSFHPEHPGDFDYERGPDLLLITKQGVEEERQKLNSKTVGVIDRSRFDNMDMIVRGWEYNHEEHPGKLSARLKALVVTRTSNALESRYGTF